MYGHSHDQNGPWVGRKLGSDVYYENPGDALEGGRASYYHAGIDNDQKVAVWVAKLEVVDVSDFLVEGLVFFLADMREKAIIEFDSGGQAFADWLENYSPIDAITGDDVQAQFTRLFDLNFGRMIGFQSDAQHWPVPALTRVCKGDSGGFLKLEVQWNQSPRWRW